jgi:two-component system chemotaxis response regulator CheB
VSKPLRVVVVDDSPICRGVLKDILEASKDIVVVGEAGEGRAAVAMAKELEPDLVTMDLDMPGVDGLETIELLMAEKPVPILVVTGEPVGPGSDLVFEAVNRGALDLLAKPSISNHVQGEHIRNHVRALAQVPVFQRMSTSKIEVAAEGGEPSWRRFSTGGPLHPATRFVAVAAGAGGSRAVASVLRGIPADFPAPIAVAQHLPEGFTEGYVTFLGSQCKLSVVVVGRDAVAAVPGSVYVAEDGGHIVCEGGKVVAVRGAAIDGYRPSATALLRSAATAYGSASVGVVLSGLGTDGADGAAAVHDAGGLTIAEDSHARPDDMPRAAVAAGAIDRRIPVQLIADMLIASASPSVERRTAPPPSPASAGS